MPGGAHPDTAGLVSRRDGQDAVAGNDAVPPIGTRSAALVKLDVHALPSGRAPDESA